jgi:2-dehydropantoate 2-reductase
LRIDHALTQETSMRILVVGAGAIGGYFGGRLKAAGRDVTFLVRARRAAQLAKAGLVIRSPAGNVELPSPPTVAAENLRAPYDLILLSCKAYDLASAIESFAPAVGPNTAILPLLNGMAHIDALTARFGVGAVLGGQCVISSTLDADGRVLHLAPMHFLSFGEQDGAKSPRAQAILAALSGAGFDANLSTAIMQEMWEKWAFIATGAGITCLLRAAFGDIIAAGAVSLTTGMYDECCAIAAANGYPPSKASTERSLGMFTAPGSTISASMLRDIERGAPIEADHVIGDLLRRGEKAPGEHRLLRIAYAHLKSYEARRGREKSTAAAA